MHGAASRLATSSDSLDVIWGASLPCGGPDYASPPPDKYKRPLMTSASSSTAKSCSGSEVFFFCVCRWRLLHSTGPDSDAQGQRGGSRPSQQRAMIELSRADHQAAPSLQPRPKFHLRLRQVPELGAAKSSYAPEAPDGCRNSFQHWKLKTK